VQPRTVRIHVRGRVQGVGFRAFVEREATLLGVVGWVRNRRDGGVEALASGPDDAIRSLCERLRSGPPAARVDTLEVRDDDAEAGAGFHVAPTV
jgi:acylphosphatase